MFLFIIILASLALYTSSFVPLCPLPRSFTLYSEPHRRKRVRKDREKAPPSPSAPPPLIESTPPPAVSFTPEIPAPANDLSSLLADAERLRAASPQEEKSVDQAAAEAIGFTIKGVIQNIIAADFFLILAFLAWFLAGVISSSVFKNDAIQLAFNGIFQPVVQPALGILMIGSLAGGVFGSDPTQDDDNN